MAKLIILRGNSGSGKSTIAKALQRRLGMGTLLLSQDTVRRDMLYVKDEPDNAAGNLLRELVLYGHSHCDIVILEGILYADYYQKLFDAVKDAYGDQIYAYYFDLPFEETLERHRQKPNAADFGEADMRRWWRDRDYLHSIPETPLSRELSREQIVERIARDVLGE